MELLGGEGVEDVVFVAADLFEGFVDVGNLFKGLGFVTLGGGGADGDGLEVTFAVGQLGAEVAQVVVEDDGDGVGAVAVHVDEDVEAAFVTTEQPVDGTLFVHLEVMAVEIAQEVAANVAADGVFNEGQILFVMVIAKGEAEEGFEAFNDVVGEPVAIEKGNDVVFIGCEAGLRNLAQVVGEGFALVGEDEAGLVEGIPAKHTADSVANELTHGVGEEKSF